MTMFTKRHTAWVLMVATLWVLAVGVLPAMAETNPARLIPFQARITDASGSNLPDGVQDKVTFNIYEQATGGTSCWTELHQNVPIVNGYVNVLLGSITSVDDPDNNSSTSDALNFDPGFQACGGTGQPVCQNCQGRGYRYLGITLGNNPQEMVPRHQIVPSFHTRTAGIANAVIDGGVETNMIAEGAVTSGKIADSSVAGAKIADGAVTSARIADGSIAAVDIANGSITAEKLASGAIPTAARDRARASRGSWNVPHPNSVSYLIPLTTEDVDTNNMHSSTENAEKLFARRHGVYLVIGQATQGPGAVYPGFGIRSSVGDLAYTSDAVPGDGQVNKNVSAIARLRPGDWVGAFVGDCCDPNRQIVVLGCKLELILLYEVGATDPLDP